MKQIEGYRQIKFAIEDGKVWEGYLPLDLSEALFGGYWNGWLCPYVDEETHQEMLKAWKEEIESLALHTWADTQEMLDDLEYISTTKNTDGLYSWGGFYIFSEVK